MRFPMLCKSAERALMWKLFDDRGVKEGLSPLFGNGGEVVYQPHKSALTRS